MLEQDFNDQHFVTRCAKVEFEGNVVKVHFRPKVQIELADMVELNQLFIRNKNYQNLIVMMKFEKPFYIQLKACSYYFRNMINKESNNHTLIVKSFFKRHIARFLVTVIKHRGDVSVFKNENQVHPWIKRIRLKQQRRKETVIQPLPHTI